jgi:UDP-N-acetylmuramate dehydrogenase
MAAMTSLELGGPARWMVSPTSEDDLVEAVTRVRGEGLQVAVVGEGSNLVVADEGFDGLVVQMGLRGFDVEAGAGEAVVTVAAGEPWDEVVARTLGEGLVGLECLSGIPGSAGATPVQNVGAYGREVSELIVAVRVLDRSDMAVFWMSREECSFGYRTSVLRRARGRFVVLAVRFRLDVGGAPLVRYAELAAALGARGSGEADPLAVRQAVLELRRLKSMVLDPSDPNRRSVGSFFVNPVLPSARARELTEAWSASHPEDPMPAFTVPGGEVKVPAAWLIERAGFSKGERRRTVGLSSRHALALVHHGGGTTAELVSFAREIRSGVRARFGVDLHPEPVFLGFDSDDPTR